MRSCCAISAVPPHKKISQGESRNTELVRLDAVAAPRLQAVVLPLSGDDGVQRGRSVPRVGIEHV